MVESVLYSIIFILGKKEFPDAEMMVKKFFTRNDKFIPEPTGTNVLFGYFAQFFTHQFFKTDFQKGPDFQWGNHGVINKYIQFKTIFSKLYNIALRYRGF